MAEQRGNRNVNYGLSLILMYQGRFILGKNVPFGWLMLLIGGRDEYVEARSTWEIFAPFSQFCCKRKTAVEKKKKKKS